MTAHNIILADDHGLVREGLKRLIAGAQEFTVRAEAGDGVELLEKLKAHPCDLIVMDLSMPRMDGLEALRIVRQEYSHVKVLVISMLKDCVHFEHAMASGASGFMAKDDACDQINVAIRKALYGKKYISPSVMTMLSERLVRSMDEAETPLIEVLTRREKEVLKLLAGGMANKNIAAKLKISSRTVANHRAHICDKLGLRTTAALVKYAFSKGLM